MTSVADLRYGSALFHYYQNEHFEALSELLVAQRRGGIQGHGDNPEIMAGGFYLAYGLERTASEIFERLLDQNRSEKTRNAAWFYLARIRYLRNDWEGAENILAKIGPKPIPELALDIQALRINLLLKQSKPAEAESLYSKALRKSSWAPYLDFNFGAAYSRAEEFDLGVRFFNRLMNVKKRSPEILALYDKAMTAAGYTRLFRKRYPEAQGQFAKVRLNSPLSNRALLGYGWSYYEQEHYLEALKPWQALSRRSVIDEFTQEALLAIPNVYEKMERSSLALKHYREAEATYESELVTLDNVIGQIANKDLLTALKVDRSEDINWLNYAKTNQLSPQISYLITLFSQERFLAAVQELRDLLVLQEKLSQWSKKMTFYSNMLKERNTNRQTEMDLIANGNLESQILALETRRNVQQEKLDSVVESHNVWAIGNDKQRDVGQRIARAQENISYLSTTDSALDERDERDERLRFVGGLHTWQAAESFSDNVWRVQKKIIQINSVINSSRAGQGRVGQIIDQGFDLQPYQQEIAQARLRISNQQKMVDSTVLASQNYLRQEVSDVLSFQKRRLKHYLSKSRLAIARLLDVAAGDTY